MCVKYGWADSSEYLLTSLLITDQAVMSSSQLLSTSADGLQHFWNIEIESMNGGKKTHWFKTHPVCVSASHRTCIFPPNNKPCDIKQWHHQWSYCPRCWAWPFASLSAPFSPFLRNNARIKAASWEKKIYPFWKDSCFLNQGVWYTRWSQMRVGLIPRPVSSLKGFFFFVQCLSLLSLSRTSAERKSRNKCCMDSAAALLWVFLLKRWFSFFLPSVDNLAKVDR